MMRWMHKHRESVFFGIAVAMTLAIVLTSLYSPGKSPDTVLIVNGEKVSRNQFQNRYRLAMDNPAGENERPAPEVLEKQIIQDFIREVVLLKEAEKYEVKVPDAELSAYIQAAPAFQRDGKFDQSAYVQFIQTRYRSSIEQFEEEQRKNLKIQKLQMLLLSGVKVGDLELQWHLRNALASQNPEAKVLAKDPEKFRERLRQEMASAAIQDWLRQVNKGIEVKNFLNTGQENPS